MNMPCQDTFQSDFIAHIRAGSPCLWVATPEELRLDQVMSDCAKAMNCQLREWNHGYGWVNFANKQPLVMLELGQAPSLAQAMADLRDEDLDERLIVIKNARLALENDKTAIARLQLLLHRIQRQHGLHRIPGDAENPDHRASRGGRAGDTDLLLRL